MQEREKSKRFAREIKPGDFIIIDNLVPFSLAPGRPVRVTAIITSEDFGDIRFYCDQDKPISYAVTVYKNHKVEVP